MQRLFMSLAASAAIVSMSGAAALACANASSSSASPAAAAPIQLAQASGGSGMGTSTGKATTPDAGTNNSGNAAPKTIPGTPDTAARGSGDTRSAPETDPKKDWPKTGGSVESERPTTTVR